ncbi:MAG: hypothetical protein PHO30_04635, partial [Candidatus Omnitrophica bacterium]|nr:hypothetical protein [Candidatus Omnitrophota bacterium]
MKHKNDEQKNAWPIRKPGIAVIGVFLIILLCGVVFMGRDFPGTHYFFKEGQISQQDVFAPFDFSFQDIDGKKIDVTRNEMIVERGKRVDKTQELAMLQLDKGQGEPKSLHYFLGIGFLLIIFAVIILTYASVHVPVVLYETKNIVLLCLLVLLLVLGAKAIIIAGWPLYLIPIASMSMLVAILIDPGVALMITIIVS